MYADMTRWGGRRECARRQRQMAMTFVIFPRVEVGPSLALIAARERNMATAWAARRRRAR